MDLTDKEIDILLAAFKQYTCINCPHAQDREVCSCDDLYYKLQSLKREG